MEVKELATVTLLAWVDMLAHSVDQMHHFGMEVESAKQKKDITDKQAGEVQEELFKHMTENDKKRLDIVTELQERLKKDTGVAWNVIDFERFKEKSVAKYPDIYKKPVPPKAEKAKAKKGTVRKLNT